MIECFKRWFSVDFMLPVNDRLGPVGTTRELYSKYLKIAWPATLQGLMLQVMTAIDLAMVGALGASALASVGIMGQPEMVILLVCRALSIAITAIIARRHGEGDIDGMNAVLKQSILLNFLIYIPLLLLSFLNVESILRFTGAEDSYIETAVWYGRFIVISLLFQSFSQVVGAALIGYGNTKVIFKANVVGNILNTILNFFLIYGIGFFPELGVMGAGVSTMISSAVIALLLLRTISQSMPDGLTLLHPSKWRFERTVLHTMYHVGGSSLGEQFFERFGMYTYTMIVASLGAVPLAAHYVCMNLMDIFYYFAMGLGFAGASHTGQSLGHKRPDIARAYASIGARIGLFVGIISAIIFVGFGDMLIQFYTRENEVVLMAISLLGIMGVAAFPQALQQVYAGVLKGAGDTYYIMKYSLLSVAIIRPIVTYVLCITLELGLTGAWLSLCIDQSIRFVCAYARYMSGKWQHRII
ncbi:MATE family efflux transporter [Veillonella caviae]|uniref:MATE family efflux transporter n=1 Tax=Veillonella caviae TaxID=248316 RepID=UPI002A9105E2|nr:MATE family efflux transporter [Veillonella caviae]MDY5409203.1 MATE family efflux transporter [Veillonella caviae]